MEWAEAFPVHAGADLEPRPFSSKASLYPHYRSCVTSQFPTVRLLVPGKEWPLGIQIL